MEILRGRGRIQDWQTLCPTTEAFLERLEVSRHDDIRLESATGLPVVCQFGRGGSSHLCAVTNEDGLVSLYDTRSNLSVEKNRIVNRWCAHKNAVFDFLWTNGDSQSLTASGDQTVVLWDMSTTQKVTTFVGHGGSVRSVAASPGSPYQFASGARDGQVMLWDVRVNKKTLSGTTNTPERAIKDAHNTWKSRSLHSMSSRRRRWEILMDYQHSVTCVLYRNENVLISSGSKDGAVKLWDTRKWYNNASGSVPQPLKIIPYPCRTGLRNSNSTSCCKKVRGVVTMCMDPWKSQLYVSYADKSILRYDLNTASSVCPKQSFVAGGVHDNFFLRSTVSPDGKYLFNCSGDKCGIIWEIEDITKQPVYLVGHSAAVTAVDWSPTDICKLATLGDDMSLKIWRPALRDPHTEDPTICGFAFGPPYKEEPRQCSVVVDYDMFPLIGYNHYKRVDPMGTWPPPTHKLTEGVSGSRDHQKRGSKSPTPAEACVTPRRSPRTPKKTASPLASTSPYALRSVVTKCALSFPCGDGERSPCRCEKQSSTALKETPSGGAPSPRTVLCKSCSKTSNSGRGGVPGQVVQSPGLSPGHSPRRKGLTPVKSPRKLTPAKSPRRSLSFTPNGSLRPRQLFSSPTASLPNSVLDPPQHKPSPPPPTPPQRKVDWLTQYRMTRSSPRQDAGSPGPSSPLSPSPSRCDQAPSLGKGGSRKGSTPKRGSSSLGKESEQVTPGKRRKVDRTFTPPPPAATRSSFSKPGTPSSRTPQRKSAGESPKTPTNMSIERYLQQTGEAFPVSSAKTSGRMN
ncbi:uncharacterized protein LOC143281687 isoform X2 [Babylonia areolata]|uniref:uncharacterized protein LOC143281687 isoform X2 n=1 Tax=Babylonia areolata TaxID=304850 RepID=UPI003FCFF697